MRVRTESGTEYRFNADMTQVRRGGSHPLRQDEQWIDLFEKPFVQVGLPMTLLLSPLSELADVTVRRTTRVLEMWP
jgi:hypothetical protein